MRPFQTIIRGRNFVEQNLTISFFDSLQNSRKVQNLTLNLAIFQFVMYHRSVLYILMFFFWCSRYMYKYIVNIAPLPSCFVLNPPSVGKASSNDNRSNMCKNCVCINSLSSPLHAIPYFYAASLGKVISRVEMKTSVLFPKLLLKICFMKISVWQMKWRRLFVKT